MALNHWLAPWWAAMLGTDSNIIAVTLTPIVPNKATSKALPDGVLASNIIVFKDYLSSGILIGSSNVGLVYKINSNNGFSFLYSNILIRLVVNLASQIPHRMVPTTISLIQGVLYIAAY
jgi:hypothetical protein